MTRWVLALCLLAALPARAAGAAPDSYRDTVLSVQRGEVLIGDGFTGRITVVAWDRDRVELVEEAGERRVTIRRTGNRLMLAGGAGRRRTGGTIQLRVPAWLPVQLRGPALTASVEGLTGVVDLYSVEGDLTCRDVAGDVFMSTVEGAVTVDGASGRLRLRSVNQQVSVTRVDADSVLVESTSGSIVLDGVSAAWLDASTTDGSISFDGDLRRDGQYRLATHDGDVIVTLPAGAGAVVSVSTFDGSFIPEFPITLERFRGGNEMSFTLGRGGARLALTAFDGDIRLRRR